DPDIDFSYSGEARLRLRSDLVASNFKRLPAGTLFAKQPHGRLVLFVQDMAGVDVTGRYLLHDRGEVRLARERYPAHYPTDPVVARDHGLCFFMHPYRAGLAKA